MPDSSDLVAVFDRRAERRRERRDFFRLAVGAAAAGTAAFALGSAAEAQAVTDNDVLNFALNLEYLEAQFYSYAYSGAGLPSSSLTGTGTAGSVTVGTTNPARKVDFSGDPLIGQYAREIANDELNHVNFLRSALASAAVAQPAINLSGDANGPFTAAALAAGVITSGVFDPYASPNNFLLGSYIFEDVGVTAYKGSAGLLTNNTFLDAAAGILAAEAFHAGIIRAALYRRGFDTTTMLRAATDKIAAARDLLDGTTTQPGPPQLYAADDQGVSPNQLSVTSAAGTSVATAANIVPTDTNGIAYGRTAQQVLNIVYLNTASAAATGGGFFPNGVNGTIRASAAK